jgi:histidinol-phosphatase (PHP family)
MTRRISIRKRYVPFLDCQQSTVLIIKQAHLDPSALEGSFDSFLSAAVELQSQVISPSLLIGVETELLSLSHLSRLSYLILNKTSLDFVVGSVHHVNCHPIDFTPECFEKALESCSGSLEELLLRYFRDQRKLIETLKPEVVGHFDLIRMFLPNPIVTIATTYPTVWREIEKNVDLIVSYGGLFEVNSAGWAKKTWTVGPWPSKEVLEVSFYCISG